MTEPAQCRTHPWTNGGPLAPRSSSRPGPGRGVRPSIQGASCPHAAGTQVCREMGAPCWLKLV